ncbi:CBS domain-containing protein [Candidatus Omnitrophota bacterium]
MKKLLKVKTKKHVPFGLKITGHIIKVKEDISVCQVANVLMHHKIGAVVVEKEGKLAGVISERDIVWRVVALGKSLDKTRAKDIMTKKVTTIDLDKGVEELYETMKQIPFRHLPVKQGDEIIGMVSSRDLKYLLKLKESRAK